MKILGFDIETYKEHFAFVGALFDTDTKTEVHRTTITDINGSLTKPQFDKIFECMENCDYMVSFNGTRFDLPVLAKIKDDIERAGVIPVKYIYSDAMALIQYDEHNNPIVKRHKKYQPWNRKHFDLLRCCLLRHSLKQWEMFQGLRIRELPYAPDMPLTQEMKDEIDDYCYYDVWAMMQIFWKYGYDKGVKGRPTLLAYIELMKFWPESMASSMEFDRTSQQLSSSIAYEQTAPVPPKEVQPFKLFNINDFDVPLDVKCLIGYIGKSVVTPEDTSYKGIVYGKGGAHFIRPGHHKDVHVFDVAHMYPSIIRNWHLLKTAAANKKWCDMIALRDKTKHDPALKQVDKAVKIFLNAFTGGFRIKSSYSPAYDPAAGEAMCYIGQLLISMVAFACPEFDKLIEVNTDSVFVIGQNNIDACRRVTEVLKSKFNIVLEEERFGQIYVRDVNNYLVYDDDGKLVDGIGSAFSDYGIKGSERAVYRALFSSVISDKVETDWDTADWRDFIVKYHKSAASKYAAIDGKPLDHKNYYFLWTTDECPDAVSINFSREFVDSKSGAIKARFGVYAFDIADLEKYRQYIDHKQYKRDLDVELTLWGRDDLVTTHLSKIQRRGVKSLKDLIQRDFI